VRKITEILGGGRRTLSFELFPPGTLRGRKQLFRAAERLTRLGPDFFSVTYGAGGSTARGTLEIAVELQRRFAVPVLHHYTCIGHTREVIRGALGAMAAAGIRNVLAMRGDVPRGQPNYRAGPDEPRFGYELVQMIRQFGDLFAVGVPGFPERHRETPTERLDSQYLKLKQDVGAEFVITQLFFDNADYGRYVERIRAAGVTMPIIPGVLPITDYDRLTEFCRLCRATVTDAIRRTFEPLRGDKARTLAAGIETATNQCRDLLDRGAPGLHFFCLNRSEPVATIVGGLKHSLV
jgi:methylenetetrahydrofolate reductase (NADPH)